MSAKAYYEKIALPLVSKLKDAIRSILLQYYSKMQELKTTLERANNQVDDLTNRLEKYEAENEQLLSMGKDYGWLRRGVGEDRANAIISIGIPQGVTEKEQASKRESAR